MGKNKETSVVPDSQLDNTENELRKTLRVLRFDRALGKLDDTSRIVKAKKDLARVMTRINDPLR